MCILTPSLPSTTRLPVMMHSCKHQGGKNLSHVRAVAGGARALPPATVQVTAQEASVSSCNAGAASHLFRSRLQHPPQAGQHPAWRLPLPMEVPDERLGQETAVASFQFDVRPGARAGGALSTASTK